MAKHWRSGSAFLIGAALTTPAFAQTAPAPSPDSPAAPGTEAPATPVIIAPAAPVTAASGTGAPAAPGAAPADAGQPLAITVTAKRLDEARLSIQPSLGASKYEFTPESLNAIPQGENAPINQVLLRAPGVAQDSFGQIHVRGDHGNVQYRVDGVQMPQSLSLFSQILTARFVDKMSLITGALPAQYGFFQAGVVDVTLKSGTNNPGAEASMTAGSYNWQQPGFSYGGRSGAIDYFVSGSYLHNEIGIENPASTAYPAHDTTSQWQALGKVTGIVDENTRVSFIAGGANAAFQIPNNPGQTPTNTVYGISNYNSLMLGQQQWETTYFGIASLQKHYGAADFQVSAFARYAALNYQPDPMGDLMFNGISPWSSRGDLVTGVQGDGSWKVAETHTLRGGFLVQREHATNLTNAQVLPVDDTGTPTSDQPIGVTFGSDQVGWLYGVYLQDEWKIAPKVTVNYGMRFDAMDQGTQEFQFSPRLNVVWTPTDILTVHGGYARYFTPPPLSQVGGSAIAVTQGTTAAPPNTLNFPLQAERSHYFDAGFEVRPLDGLKIGLDAYYKIATNLLDDGQFGAPIVLTSFNYANAEVKGIELSSSYENGPWSLYANLAWSDAQGTNINSAQFNFQPADLTYIYTHNIYLDHNQSFTASAGASYIFNQESDHASRISADMILGSGLRSDYALPDGSSIPNGIPLPYYATFNLSAEQRIPIKGTRGTTVRFDALNLLDNSYAIRDGTGVGVGAPQYGQRRTFLVTLTQKF